MPHLSSPFLSLSSSLFPLLSSLSELVEAANDPLEVEETYVMQQLMTEFPMKYDVPSK